MIQRIQTIFLALAAIAVAVLFFIPMGTFTVIGNQDMADDIVELSIYGLKSVVPGGSLNEYSYSASYALIILTAFAIIIPLATIFMFKNRELQLKMCRVEILLNTIILVVMTNLYIDKIAEQLLVSTTEYYCIIPLVISIIFAVLAFIFIKKDINLLRSTERLR